jgi:hypothetical protein
VGRLLPIVLCVALLAACGGDDEPQPAGPGLSRAELRWVRAFAAWGEHVGRAMEDAAAAHEIGLGGGDYGVFVRALRPLRRCADSLEREVGEAPTDRLRSALGLLERTCGAYRGFADSQEEALRGDPGEALVRAQAASTRGDELLLQAYERIGGLLRDARPLPRRHGGDGSRIDPLYSRVGSELAYEQVEVRCWSREEWRDVIRERSVFSNGYLNVHETLGFAWVEDRRAHLAPSICRGLDSLSLEGRTKPLEAAATAVVVLAHEIGHLRAPAADEAEVECRAVQEARGVARSLGASAEEADELVRTYWDEVYPNVDDLYQSTECHPGGYLDLEPSNPRWP